VEREFLAAFPDVLDLPGAKIQKLETTKSAHASSDNCLGFAPTDWVHLQSVSNMEGCANQRREPTFADFHGYGGCGSAPGNAQSDRRAEPVSWISSSIGKSRGPRCVYGCLGNDSGIHDILTHFPNIGRSVIIR